MYDRNKVLIGLAVFVVAMTYPFEIEKGDDSDE